MDNPAAWIALAFFAWTVLAALYLRYIHPAPGRHRAPRPRCGATAPGISFADHPPETLGPCVLPTHTSPWHRDATGARWRWDQDDPCCETGFLTHGRHHTHQDQTHE